MNPLQFIRLTQYVYIQTYAHTYPNPRSRLSHTPTHKYLGRVHVFIWSGSSEIINNKGNRYFNYNGNN